jgi:hypothetical protein
MGLPRATKLFVTRNPSRTGEMAGSVHLSRGSERPNNASPAKAVIVSVRVRLHRRPLGKTPTQSNKHGTIALSHNKLR